MKRKRTYDEIHADRFQGSGFMAYYPAVHTPSGCRFSFTTQVDYETYENIKARKEEKAREKLDRDLRIRELLEKDELTEEGIRKRKRKYYRMHEAEINKKRKALKNDESSKEKN